jgi:hypothetical protein
VDRQNLPEAFTPGAVARPASGAVAGYHDAQLDVHTPGELYLEPGLSPDECWELLSPNVRDRVLARAGRIVERWAYQAGDDRVAVVALGERGLVTVEPTVNARGGPASSVQLLAAATGSARSVQIAEDTAAARHATPATYPPSQGYGGARRPEIADRLPPDFVKFLGNLPARAQSLLQDPFTTGNEALYCDHFYRQAGASQSAGLKTLRVWCYLTDRRRVTFLSGQGVTYGLSFAAARWHLTCWRFDVEPSTPR